MKIFQIVRKSFATMKYSADGHWCDIGLMTNTIKCVLVLALQCIFLFRVADTPEELMHSISHFSVGILVFISYLSTVQQMADIFRLMDRVEKVINKSKLAN